MSKKILCLFMAVAMLVCAIALSGCSLFEEETTEEADSRLPMTLSVLGIKKEGTTDEAVQAVEDAINVITVAKYETKIKLTLVTEDEYYDLVTERVAEAKYNETVDKAIEQYNKYAKEVALEKQKALNNANSKSSGKLRRSIETVQPETMETRPVYSKEETTYIEGIGTVIVYPEPTSPVDILMISGKEMYDLFNEEGILASLDTTMTTSSDTTNFTKLTQYIYPTFFSQLKEISGTVNAIPNNNLLAEYTYIVVDKALADEFRLNIDEVSGYGDLSDFLASVKAKGGVTPFESVPDPLGIFYPFGKEIAVASYFDPIFGYDKEEGKSFTVSNLFDIPQYTNHLALMDTYKSAGYFDKTGDKFAVAAIKGDASVEDVYGEDYYVKVIQNPFVEEQVIFNGMMAVSSIAQNDVRALELIQAFNTDPDLKNLLQYGIEGVNYEVNSDGLTIKRLNSEYMMDTKLTGNVYMGYPEEGQSADIWENYKATNISSALSPFLICYTNSESFESNLSVILKRAGLSEALAEIGLTYEGYFGLSKTDYNKKSKELRLLYTDYLKECLKTAGVKDEELMKQDEKGQIYYKSRLLEMVETATDGIYSQEWYNDRIAEKFVNEKYGDIISSAGIRKLAEAKISAIIGIPFEKTTHQDPVNKTKTIEDPSLYYYRNIAEAYYTNISYLRIMAEKTVFKDLSEDERSAYSRMTDTEFEAALLKFVTETYIKDNDLDDEKFAKLVRDYCCKGLTFYSDTGDEYSVTWEGLDDEKKAAQPFADAVTTLVRVYADLFTSTSYDVTKASATPTAIVEELHDILYRQYLADNDVTMSEFQTAVYDEILSPFGITKAEFDQLKTTDKADYDKYASKLISKYKDRVLETYSKEKIKATGNYALTTSDVLSAVLASFIEYKTQIYHKLCEEADISYADFIESKAAMVNYIKWCNSMKTQNYYTLTSEYSTSEYNNFKWDEIQQVVFDNISTIGYYYNEMAKLVGSNVDKYMEAKGYSKSYISYLNKIIDSYADKIVARGYDLTAFKAMNHLDIEEIIISIAEEECSAGKRDLEEVLKEACKPYIEGLASASDAKEYCKTASEALAKNYLVVGTVSTFKANVEQKLAELAD